MYLASPGLCKSGNNILDFKSQTFRLLIYVSSIDPFVYSTITQYCTWQPLPRC